MKREILWILGIEEGEENVKYTEITFNKIIEKNSTSYSMGCLPKYKKHIENFILERLTTHNMQGINNSI